VFDRGHDDDDVNVNDPCACLDWSFDGGYLLTKKKKKKKKRRRRRRDICAIELLHVIVFEI